MADVAAFANASFLLMTIARCANRHRRDVSTPRRLRLHTAASIFIAAQRPNI